MRVFHEDLWKIDTYCNQRLEYIGRLKKELDNG